MTNKALTLLATLPLFLGLATTTLAKDDVPSGLVGICHVKGTPPYEYTEVAPADVPTHLGHGDFLYAGPSGTHAEKTAWCNDNRPTPNVPEFGLTTGLIAMAVSAGSFVLLRTRFA